MAEEGVPHYTEWTPRLIRRSRYEYADEFRETSNIMDLLGYGPVIRQIRRNAYKELDRIYNTWAYGQRLCIITAGSKLEGLTGVYENDTDRIHVPQDVLCLEEGIDLSTIPGHITLFKMNVQWTSAGYCRLLLGRLIPKGSTAIINSICDDGRGNFLLNTSLYLEQFMPCGNLLGLYHLERAGPSLPCTNGVLTLDMVYDIRCYCSVILQTWANRTRHWPPSEVVEKLVAMEAFVTPVGYKGSAYNHMGWRICLNSAETELVNNLNDTQVKIYVILKMIVKDILKPQIKEITSDTLKNIVLWLSENNPQALFHTGSLFHWLHEGLDMLRMAISTRQLPYYMIP